MSATFKHLKEKIDITGKYMYEVRDREGVLVTVLYFSPVTLAQRAAAEKLAMDENGSLNATEWGVNLLILKARNNDDKPAFDAGDVDGLMSELPYNTVNDMITFMMDCGKSVANQKKS